MGTEALRIEEATFEENGRKTLNDLGFSLGEGEVLGVFSNHASVKNALAAILGCSAVLQSGRIYVFDQPWNEGRDKIGKNPKISIIQSLNLLIDDLSVADNIFAIRKGFSQWFIDAEAMYSQTEKLMEDFGVSIDARASASKLKTIERMILVLIKAYALGARIILLQDMLGLLSEVEIEQLYGFIRVLSNRGASFLLVESSAGFLGKYADRVIVIKGGRNAWEFGRGELDEGVLARYFYKEQSLQDISSGEQAETVIQKKVALSFEHVEMAPFEPLNFMLYDGEALAIMDRDGRGIEGIKSLLLGRRRDYSGKIIVDGKQIRFKNPRNALDEMVAFIPENPLDNLLFSHLKAIDNLCMAASRKTMDFWMNPVYKQSIRKEYAQYFAEGSLDKYVDELSMQEQHKLVYCIWHLYKPKVVVCIKPFNSLDSSLKEISMSFMDLLSQKGIAILILTTNDSEIIIPCKKMSISAKE